MQVSKWGNSLAVRLPVRVVEALGLKAGDEIEIHVAGKDSFAVARDQKRIRALEELRRLSKRNGPLPDGFKFDREEAHARGRVL